MAKEDNSPESPRRDLAWVLRGNITTAKRVIIVAAGSSNTDIRANIAASVEWIHGAEGHEEIPPSGYESGSAYVLVRETDPAAILEVCQAVRSTIEKTTDSSAYIALYAPNVDPNLLNPDKFPTPADVPLTGPDVLVVDQKWDTDEFHPSQNRRAALTYSTFPDGSWRPTEILELDGAGKAVQEGRTRALPAISSSRGTMHSGTTTTVNEAAARGTRNARTGTGAGTQQPRTTVPEMIHRAELREQLERFPAHPTGILVVVAPGANNSEREQAGIGAIEQFKEAGRLIPQGSLFHPDTTICLVVDDPSSASTRCGEIQRRAREHLNADSPIESAHYMARQLPTVVYAERPSSLGRGTVHLPAHVFVVPSTTNRDAFGYVDRFTTIHPVPEQWIPDPTQWSAIIEKANRSRGLAQKNAEVYSRLDPSALRAANRRGRPMLLHFERPPTGTKIIVGPGLVNAQLVDVIHVKPSLAGNGKTMGNAFANLSPERSGTNVIVVSSKAQRGASLEMAQELVRAYAPSGASIQIKAPRSSHGNWFDRTFTAAVHRNRETPRPPGW